MINSSTLAFAFIYTTAFTKAVNLAYETPIGGSFEMTELQESNFYGLVVRKDDNIVIGEKAWFINFVKPVCGHCKEFSSTWAEFHQNHSDELNVAQVDCTGDGHSLC